MVPTNCRKKGRTGGQPHETNCLVEGQPWPPQRCERDLTRRRRYEPAPAMVPPSKHQLGEQPCRRRHQPGLDLHPVGVTRAAFGQRYEDAPMVPAPDQASAAVVMKSPTAGPGIGDDFGDDDVLPAEWNETEQPHRHLVAPDFPARRTPLG